MRTFAQKPKAHQQATPAKSTVPSRAHFRYSHEMNSILHLQRTIGNQAVQQILQAKAEELWTGAATTSSPHFGHDFSHIPVHPKSPANVQTTLTVARPGDLYEQEADYVSEQVMRMSALRPRSLWQRGAAEHRDREHERLQTNRTSEAGDLGQTAAPPIVHEVLSTPGQPLDPAVRAFMEPRFGQDFGRIRIHNDLRAAESARAIDALAYTLGEHLVFDAGQYAPNTSYGKQLLSHELTHSMQQHHGQVHRAPQRVKIGKPVVSTDREQAMKKAREIAELINSGKWKLENYQQLAHWLEFFEGIALVSFITALQDATGKKISQFESDSVEHTDIFATSTKLSVIVPTSEARVTRGGFKVAYFAQIFEESSTSTSVEVYADNSAGAGLGIELPIRKIAKFRFGAEARKGRKTSDREEEKKASRSGRTISRSFTIQKVERDVLNYQAKKTYVEPAPIAKEVIYEKAGHNPEIQYGFQVVPDEGGKPWGPFWNEYSGHVQAEGSALPPVWDVLRVEQKNIAEDLVFGRH